MRAEGRTTAVKVVHILLNLALAVVLARTLGPELFGVYSYILALVILLAVPAQFGLPNLLIRETAKAYVEERWSTMRGVWKWAALVAVLFSLVIMVMACLVATVYWSPQDEARVAFFVATLLIPILTMQRLGAGIVQGVGLVVQGQVGDLVMRPSILLAFVLVLIVGLDSVAVSDVMSAHVGAAVVALLFCVWLVKKATPKEVYNSPCAMYDRKKWTKSAASLALIAGAQIINNNIDLIMVGIFLSSYDVAIYRVAAQGAMLMMFGIQAVNAAMAPRVAGLYALGDLKQLQHVVRVSSKLIVAITVPPTLVVIIFGTELVTFVFGEAYTESYLPLVILCLGKLFNSIFGSVALLLNMTGNEKATVYGTGVAALANVVLNIVLIPTLGLIGAAVATTLSLVIWTLVLWRNVWVRLEINGFAFAR